MQLYEYFLLSFFDFSHLHSAYDRLDACLNQSALKYSAFQHAFVLGKQPKQAAPKRDSLNYKLSKNLIDYRNINYPFQKGT
jgi:hypothetical protein